MLRQLKNRKQEGFTIIEVLIVLAIAGLILLIVFLAVPALQRSSRNTTAKNDVQNVVGGVSEYQGANNGSLPTGIAGTGTISYTGSGTNTTSIKVQGTTVVALNSGSTTGVAGPGVGNIMIVLKAQCATTTTTTPNTRSVAAFYTIETSSAKLAQCIDS